MAILQRIARPRQDAFWETIDLPMADAFEAADNAHQGALEPVGGQFAKEVQATGGCCPVRLMGGWGWPCPMKGTGCSSSECEEADGFTLINPPAKPSPIETSAPSQRRQRVLLTGLDLLPGQEDLFTTDGDLIKENTP